MKINFRPLVFIGINKSCMHTCLCFFFSALKERLKCYCVKAVINSLMQRDRAAWLMSQKDSLLDTVAENLLDRLEVVFIFFF